METSFFSGSENLYKYLVTIGLLLIVMTVYYPLREKQDLQILTIKLEKDIKILKYKIAENDKDVINFKRGINHNGSSQSAKFILLSLDKLNQNNNFSQFEVEKNFKEIKTRRNYIFIYNLMFWIFFPIGIFLTIYGFIKWKKAKKYDDNILKLENEKLELEVRKLREGI